MDRTRRRFFGTVVAALFAPAVAVAQATARTYRVAWIGLNVMSPPWTPGSPIPPMGPGMAAFRDRLAELGFVEGKNLELRVFMPRSPVGPDMEVAVREAVEWKADVIKVQIGRASCRERV